MERLTQWIDENRAIPRVDLRRCGHERCTTQLARYEDIGLTPEQIISIATELKEYKQLELSPKRLSEHVAFCRRYRELFGAIDFSRLMELVEQDTAKATVVDDMTGGIKLYSCPACDMPVHEKDIFCSECGQRLEHKEERR